MKKIVLTAIVMCFLMSFTSTNKEEIVEELPSPECFEYADSQVEWRKDCIGFSTDLDEYEYWMQAYDDCERVTNFDEFRFPPL